MYKFLPDFPPFSRNPDDIEKLFGKSPIGLDLEFSGDNPTILGLSDGVTNVSVPFREGAPYLRELLERYPDTVFVGHNVIGADMFVLAKKNIHLKLENMQDTIIWHYLVNPHLCKSTGKAALDEDGGSVDRRGRGFMNLGTFCSVYTDLAYWKTCRGAGCEGPCPVHDEYWYNMVDAYSGLVGLPAVRKAAQYRRVDKLYPLHRDLSLILAQIQESGVRIDVPYVEQLQETFLAEKEEIAKELPFNPKSWQQVKLYFKDKHQLSLKNTDEDSIRELVEELGEDEVPEELVWLLDYKELGKGVDSWFAPQYRDKSTGYMEGYLDGNGYVHPHQAFFTSSSRLMCSGPNFHNVPKRRRSRKTCQCEHSKGQHSGGACSVCACKMFIGYPVGKMIRRAIIAPEGQIIVRADFSNAENRNFLYQAGYEAPEGDLHQWMVGLIGLKEDDAFSVSLGSARDASKSVSHAADYGEGLQLKEPSALRTPKIRKEIDCGARIVFPDWTFNKKVVTFTGINLANRAFGSATYENRAKANGITRQYIDETFPKVRDLQRRIFKQVEQEGCVRTPHGYCVLLYGPREEDKLKTALAIMGSSPIAHMLKMSIVKSWRAYEAGRPQRVCLSVHDELLTYTSMEPLEGCAALKDDMNVESPDMPGFKVPAEASYGPSWGQQTKVK